MVVIKTFPTLGIVNPKTMIHQALSFLASEVNEYLLLKTEASDMLELAPLADANGDLPFDSLGMALVGIEEEKTNKSREFYRRGPNDEYLKSNPEIYLNLLILIAANFDGQYKEALKFMGHIITFFQGKNVFDHQNAPSLDDGIEKLVVELMPMTFEQNNHLWGFLGAKHLPSVVYKVRMIAIRDDRDIGIAPPIETIETNLL